jgi:NodT family efflux transporter outer membrane factor (OMF) lipoprotein
MMENPFRKGLTCLGNGENAIVVSRPMSGKIVQAVFFGLMATFLSGCMTKRNSYDVPEIPLPAQYKNSLPKNISPSPPTSIATPTEPDVKAATPDASQDVGLVEWWRSFGNSELVELIDRGLANNPDIRIATQQMAEAKTRVDQARAGLLPAISAPIEIANQAPGGSIGIVTPGSNTTSQKTYQAGVQGNWRVDLWGERSSLAESAKFQLLQAAFNRDNVQRNMTANIASSYVEYLSLNDRLRLARETDAVLSHMLDSIVKRVDVGDATLIELDQQKAAIFAVRATIPTLEQQREDALATIAFLVGSVPGSLKLSGDGLDSLFLPSVIPALPSSLLLRRPDVRMAEARLLSADADVDVARARILPPLDLSAQVGHSSLAMSQFFQPSTLFWNAISNLTISIFDGGKLKSDQENAQAVHEEMVETYARTIYQAAKEVESSLAAIRLNSNRLASQQEATTSARRAWDSSAKVYAAGGMDYQSLLDAERNYHRYLDDYLRIRMDSYRGYISLTQALGGGVNFVEQIPRKEVHRVPVRSDTSDSASLAAQKSGFVTDGVDWTDGASTKGGGLFQIENFWQVELPGLYQRSTIGATWRDLRTRYPTLMNSRVVRARLDGKTENGTDEQLSLFRLYVGKFTTPEAAHKLCAALKANYQRCRVVSSRKDEAVVEPPLPQKDNAPATVSGTDGVRNSGVLSTKEPSPMAVSSKTAEPVASEADVKSSPALPSPLGVQPESTVLAVKSVPADPADILLKQDKVKGKLAYTVQLGAFSTLGKAEKSQLQWQSKGYKTYICEIEIKDVAKRRLYTVRTGMFIRRREASPIMRALKHDEGLQATLVLATVGHADKPAVNVNHLSEMKIDVTFHRSA